MLKRIIASLLCASLFLCALTACGSAPAAPSDAVTVTVTDCAGRKVTVPKEPVSICTLCPFSGHMAILLGAGEQITSTVNNVSRSELIREICPSITQASVVKNSGSVNAEEILRLGTDLIIVNDGTYRSDAEKAKLDAIGVPYVVIGYETIDEQLKAVEILGKTLGKQEKAAEYVKYFRDVIETISGVQSDQTPRLYHAVNEAVRTDAADSYCAEWIALTGADNVSTAGGSLRMDGDKAFTTLEQIYAWDPDLIVCNEAQVDDYILTDAKWQGLRAVQEKKVYQIPVGVTRWGHPTSVETPLAILWLAALLHPDALGHLDMNSMIRDFYKRFFDYELSDAWLTAILEADSMRTPRTESGGQAA